MTVKSKTWNGIRHPHCDRPERQHARWSVMAWEVRKSCRHSCEPKGQRARSARWIETSLHDCRPKGQHAEQDARALGGELGYQGHQGQPRQGGDREMLDPLLRRLKGQGFRTDDGECCGQEPGIRTVLLGLTSTRGDKLQCKPKELMEDRECCETLV